MNTAKIIAATQNADLLRNLADMMKKAMDNSGKENHDTDLLWDVWFELREWKIKDKNTPHMTDLERRLCEENESLHTRIRLLEERICGMIKELEVKNTG